MGLKYFYKDVLTEGSKLSLVATMNVIEHDWYEAHLNNVSLGSRKIVADFSAGFMDMEDEDFYGFGMNTDGDVELDFVRKEYGKNLVLFGNLEMCDIENTEPNEFEKIVQKSLKDGTIGQGRGFVLMP